MVVETRGGEDEVARRGDVCRLELLALLARLAVGVEVGVVEEGEMACTKIHRWGDTQLQVGVEPQLTEHADVETHVPTVLVDAYYRL